MADKTPWGEDSMSHSLPEYTFEFTVISAPDGIIQSCKKCTRAFSVGGRFALKVITHLNHSRASAHKYLGPETLVVCCGEQKQAIQTFETEEEVVAALQKIQEIISRDGDASALPLVAVPPTCSEY